MERSLVDLMEMVQSIQSLAVFILTFAVSEIQASINCFECQHIKLPSDCTNLVTCKTNQECFIEEVNTGYNLMHYNIGCKNSTACTAPLHLPLIGKRSISKRSHRLTCRECCKDDYCNAYGCNSLKIECSSRLGLGYFYDSTSDACSNVVKDGSLTFNQSEADVRCRKDGADLVSINTEEHQYELFSQIYTHYRNTTDFWIGLKANVSGSHHFQWPGGHNTTYTNWGYSMISQPSDRLNKTENCVYLKSRDYFNWYDEHCEKNKTGFICEITAKNLGDACRRQVSKGYYYNSKSAFCIRLVYSSTNVFNYTDAEKECAFNNATLVKVDTYQKMDFLIRWINVNQANTNDFWIGLKDRNDTSTFTWPDGTAVNYSRWGGPEYPKPPNSQPDELYNQIYNQECVFVTTSDNGTWYDDKCDVIKDGHICQFKGKTDKETENGCYSLLTQGFYFDYGTKLCVGVFNSSGLTRNDAEQDCQSYNSSLVEILSSRETTFIQALIHKLNASTEFWVGGKDIHKNGTFYWERSGQHFNYTDWHKVQNQTAEDCVIMDRTDQFRWYPANCAAKKHGYICGIDKRTIIQNTIAKYMKLHPTKTSLLPTSASQPSASTTTQASTTTSQTTTTSYITTTTTQSSTTTTTVPTTTTAKLTTTATLPTTTDTTTLPTTTTAKPTTTITIPTTTDTTTLPTTTTAKPTTTATIPTTTDTTTLPTTPTTIPTTTATLQTTTDTTTLLTTTTAKLTMITTMPTTSDTTTTKSTTTSPPITVSSTLGRTIGPYGYLDISRASPTSVCIKVYTRPLSFPGAIYACKKDNATLVFPTSANMMNDIQTFVDSHYKGISSFLIGVVSYSHNSTYTSVTRQSTNFTDWLPGEPIIGKLCVKANENSGYKWQSTDCPIKLPYMCQKQQGC